jgi:hypothetical protein
MKTQSEGFDLAGAKVSGDDAIRQVMALRAKLQEKEREIKSLREDRADLLSEFTNLRKATYPAPLPKAKKNPPKKGDFIRILAGDVHGSAMDRPAVEAFLRDVKQWQPNEIVLGGDIIECGGFLAEHHTMGYIAETDYTYQDDIAAATWFLDQLQEAAPNAKIIFIEGNHDERPERWVIDKTIRNGRDAEFLRSLISPRTLLNLDERGIEFFSRGVNYVPGLPNGWIKLGKIYITHELGGGKNAARDSVNKTAGNVVFFHTHRADSATMVFPNVGLVTAWNPGCLCQLQRMWNHSDPTGWNHGYAIQFVSNDGNFLHIQVPINDGVSLIGPMHDRMKS